MAAFFGRHRWLTMLQLGLFDSTADADLAGGTPPEAGTVAPPVGRVREGGPAVVSQAGVAELPVPPLLTAGLSGEPVVEYVRHATARRYLLRVRPDGTVRVTIPKRGSKREAVAFYEQHAAWVTSQRARVAELRKRLPADLPVDEQRRLRRKAAKELPERLHHLAARVGLSVRKVSVRDQKHRWGSCSTSGLICLNWRLVTMPDWVRDYVIYHELMHLKRMDHSPAFWKLVAEVCPNFREARRWLRTHALAPHAAGDEASG